MHHLCPDVRKVVNKTKGKRGIALYKAQNSVGFGPITSPQVGQCLEIESKRFSFDFHVTSHSWPTSTTVQGKIFGRMNRHRAITTIKNINCVLCHTPIRR